MKHSKVSIIILNWNGLGDSPSQGKKNKRYDKHADAQSG